MTDSTSDPIVDELTRTLDPFLLKFLEERDAAAQFLVHLPKTYPPAAIAQQSVAQRAWELVGLYLLNHNRPHEGIAVFAALYRQMLEAQRILGRWIHKAMPLVWISDSYRQLDFPVLSKRYLMLTLCDDAI